ncbi:MAG: circadian clock protein KaiA [Geitlerinemataceae cyanobacterium]
MSPLSAIAVHSQLSICTFLPEDSIFESVCRLLGREGYVIEHFQEVDLFLKCIEQSKHQLDCLILQESPELGSLIAQLNQQVAFLPAAIVQLTSAQVDRDCPFYHKGEVRIFAEELSDIDREIDNAIAQFLKLSPAERFPKTISTAEASLDSVEITALHQQQKRLSEKLKERLGYLGVYYKRNPQMYVTNLPELDRQQFLKALKSNYREIVLEYFSEQSYLNQKIDEFVDFAFFADLSVTTIVELHMELMDEFATQLKLEGRSEEILLDYRLTLIDVIAHLCEMYRRSIPRES